MGSSALEDLFATATAIHAHDTIDEGVAEDEASTTLRQQLFPTRCAFPSPASVTDALSSPTLIFTLRRKDPACNSFAPTGQLTPDDAVLENRLLPTMPDDVEEVNSLATPRPTAESHVVDARPSRFVGGALAIMPIVAPARTPTPTSREGPGLRLPSFQQLGIAAPYSGGGGNTATSQLSCHDSPLRQPFDSLNARLPCRGTQQDAATPVASEGDARALKSPVYHFINTLTPPVETGRIAWDSHPAVRTAGMYSPPAHAAGGAERGQGEGASSSQQMGGVGAALSCGEEQESSDVANDADRPWIDGALSALLGNLRLVGRPSGSLKVLSHALPSTSTTGHIFAQVINAIHELTPVSPTTPTTWINVFHAIPGRFNLADLPTSPPSTPGPAVGGEDYFTQKTFDSAVSVSDYQVASPLLPRSPRPVVPPSSIDVSIVERYIPPSSSLEFAEMFDPNGSSILVDRLVELSPNNGSLLFIYPTRQGGQTFMREYLSPLLDPVLRTMGVVHGLPSGICSSIGSMTAVNDLLDHDALHRRMSALCAKLTQQHTAAQRLHGRRPKYSVSYASKQTVKVCRGVWAREWWAKQEKVRVKEALTQHARDAETRRTGNEFGSQAATATVLVQNLLERVIGKEGQEKEIPERGLEVSVFVVKRSL